MLHHEESPEKPHIIMQPPISRQPPSILPNPPFLVKNFQTPPISINFEKVDLPFMKGGGSELC